jgi:hypothetical protein
MNYLKYVYSSFIRKNVVFPGGEIYALSRSIPTGHSWTSLIGTISNWILCRYVCHIALSRSLNDRIRLALSGDDHLIGLPLNDVEVVEFIKEAGKISEKILCAKIKESAVRFGSVDAASEEDGVLFLGNVYMNGTVGMISEYMRNVSLFPEKRRETVSQQFHRRTYMTSNAPGNPATVSYFRKYFKKLSGLVDRRRLSQLLQGRTVEEDFLLYLTDGYLLYTNVRTVKEAAFSTRRSQAEHVFKDVDHYNAYMKRYALRKEDPSYSSKVRRYAESIRAMTIVIS